MRELSNKDKKIIYYVLAQMKSGDFRYLNNMYLASFTATLTDFVNENHTLSKEMISTIIEQKNIAILDETSTDVNTSIDMCISNKLINTMVQYTPNYIEEEWNVPYKLDNYQSSKNLLF